MEYVIDFIAFLVLVIGATINAWVTTKFNLHDAVLERIVVDGGITVLTVMAMNLVVAIVVHLGHFPYNHFLFPFVGE